MVIVQPPTHNHRKPFMQSRQSIVEIFSTFVQFNADSFAGWTTDPKLRRSMQNCLKQSDQSVLEGVSENFWALYWHKSWQTQASTQSNRLAIAHVTAYLQEVCYWVARKMAMNLAGRQSASDLFQTAIVRINHVLKGFNPQFSSNLKSYAEFAFSNIIKDTLRKQREADICTDWALLQKTSQKRLVESLEHAGLDSQAIAAHSLAWNCFKELYVPGDVKTTRKLAKPEAVTWQKIAKLYNSQRLSQLSSAGTDCSPERLEQWMIACAKAIRTFRYPSSISIDKPATDQDSVDLVERLPSEQDSLLAEMMLQEEAEDRQVQLNQIGTVLADAIAKLDSQTQPLLQAYYGQEATQQQVAQLLNIKQYTVSRRLTSVRQLLLKTLAQWSQETLHIPLTSDVLSSMSTVLEEWLSAHYRRSEPRS